MNTDYNHFFEVESDFFSGPVDLLLHLVKKNELEIERVSLALVCTQYLDCIETMKKYDLEIAAEYLVIAATLLAIKSAYLLREPIEFENPEDDTLDPHDELLKRLKDAAVFKEGAKKLATRKLLDFDVFETTSSLRSFPTPEVGYANHDSFLLGKAFRALLEESPENYALYTVTLESVSVVDTMRHIVDYIKASDFESVDFEKLIPDVISKSSVIATFISILELCKRQVIKVLQEKEFDSINISLAMVDIAEVLNFTSEFDEVSSG